ncbi:hypothetical protein KEM56_007221 [Ascosphaera pollenicola]|nr:hypothetical protein KEM56_007221 [Ascosphaera pollenicola]
MSEDAAKVEELLRKPLYIFDLPQELLNTLILKSAGAQRSQIPLDEEAALSTRSATDTEDSPAEIASATSCSLCQVKTATVQDQREHAKSDHHRYNLKAKLRGGQTFNEAEFYKSIGDLDESISGSDSESSEDDSQDGEKGTMLATLLKKQARIISRDAEDDEVDGQSELRKQPFIWFGSSLLPPATSLGVYRGLFSTVEQSRPEALMASLKTRQFPAIPPKRLNNSTPLPSGNIPHYFLCMIGGGHFAAAIVSLAPVLHVRAGGVEDRQPHILAHKTFHRYTTRRKQGGSQSAMDNSNRPASTAGSSLRRYNETALQTDVRSVLFEWKEWIDTSELIFIRATGNTNRRVLFGPYEGQVLRPNDERIRGFPFSTKRATQSELLRAFMELTRVKVSHIDETALAAAAEKQKKEAAALEAERLRKSTQKKDKPTTRKLSAEEEEHMLHTTQIQALIRRSKIPALLSYLSNNSLPSTFVFHRSPSTSQKGQSQQQQSHSHASTPLHLAASLGSSQIVDALLFKAKLDPTIHNTEGKTPFEVSSNRATRDTFRIARHELGESAWDWTAARVPGPLVRKDVESKQAAEKAAADEAEKQRRTAEVERLRKEEEARKANEREKNLGTGKTLASLEKTWTEKREEETRGMTPEMRMKLERERRARAAEERIKRMQQARK